MDMWGEGASEVVIVFSYPYFYVTIFFGRAMSGTVVGIV